MAWLGLQVKSRRRLLVGIALVLAAADGIWWASRQHGAERQEYELGLDDAGPVSIWTNPAEREKIPLYDDRLQGWTRAGKPVGSISELSLDHDRPVERLSIAQLEGPDILLFRMATDAGQASFRHALLAMVKEGRCVAAIATGVPNRNDGKEDVPVHRLNWVRDDDGTIRKCQPR